MLNDIFSKIDQANFKPKCLILIHGAKHPTTGREKVLFDSFEPEKINSVPQDILEKAKQVNSVQQFHEINSSFRPTECPFIDYACTNELPISNRNANLIPNVVAVTQDISIWQRCADAQGKKLSKFEGWAKRNPNFNCKQLREYAASVGKGNICTAHLLEALK
jgi:hypothetical protein